jgi:DNA-binding MarR family transcriptional regulator
MYMQRVYIHKIMKSATGSTGRSLVADAREAIDVCHGLNVRLAARRITRFMDRRLESAGLSLAQFALMVQIAAAGDDTISALAERADLDPSTLSRNLRGLERAGLVEIAMVERDLRRRAVWLTETGARRLRDAMPVWRAAHAALSSRIPPGRVRKLAADCAKLATDAPTAAE